MANHDPDHDSEINDDLDLADELMEQGECEQAHTLLRQALDDSEYERSVCQAALSIYLLRDMHDEALRILEEYKKRSGEDLDVEWTFDDIVKEKREKELRENQYSSTTKKVFKAHFLRNSLFCLIRDVTITDDFLLVRTVFKQHCYRWNEIPMAIIIAKVSNFQIYETLYLKCRNRVYKFGVGVSPSSWSIEAADVFFHEIKKKIKVEYLKQNENAVWSILVGIVLF